MIIYAVVLILVMLFTWSPKVKQLMQVVAVWFKTKLKMLFKKESVKEVEDNG